MFTYFRRLLPGGVTPPRNKEEETEKPTLRSEEPTGWSTPVESPVNVIEIQRRSVRGDTVPCNMDSYPCTVSSNTSPKRKRILVHIQRRKSLPHPDSECSEQSFSHSDYEADMEDINEYGADMEEDDQSWNAIDWDQDVQNLKYPTRNKSKEHLSPSREKEPGMVGKWKTTTEPFHQEKSDRKVNPNLKRETLGRSAYSSKASTNNSARTQNCQDLERSNNIVPGCPEILGKWVRIKESVAKTRKCSNIGKVTGWKNGDTVWVKCEVPMKPQSILQILPQSHIKSQQEQRHQAASCKPSPKRQIFISKKPDVTNKPKKRLVEREPITNGLRPKIQQDAHTAIDYDLERSTNVIGMFVKVKKAVRKRRKCKYIGKVIERIDEFSVKVQCGKQKMNFQWTELELLPQPYIQSEGLVSASKAADSRSNGTKSRCKHIRQATKFFHNMTDDDLQFGSASSISGGKDTTMAGSIGSAGKSTAEGAPNEAEMRSIPDSGYKANSKRTRQATNFFHKMAAEDWGSSSPVSGGKGSRCQPKRKAMQHHQRLFKCKRRKTNIRKDETYIKGLFYDSGSD